MRSLESGQGCDARSSDNIAHLVLCGAVFYFERMPLCLSKHELCSLLSLSFPLYAHPVFNLPSCKPLF